MLPLLGSFLVVALAIVLVFAYVALSTRSPRPVDYRAAYRLRGALFLVLSPLLLVLLALTLPLAPYAEGNARADRVVYAVSGQYAFVLAETPVPDERAWRDRLSGPPLVLPAKTLVEFRVSSVDVNHGLGLYGPDARLVAQTQAMPGVVNRMLVRLDTPGTYTVLCLEYCGVAHHAMRATLEVR